MLTVEIGNGKRCYPALLIWITMLVCWERVRITAGRFIIHKTPILAKYPCSKIFRTRFWTAKLSCRQFSTEKFKIKLNFNEFNSKTDTFLCL